MSGFAKILPGINIGNATLDFRHAVFKSYSLQLDCLLGDISLFPPLFEAFVAKPMKPFKEVAYTFRYMNNGIDELFVLVRLCGKKGNE